MWIRVVAKITNKDFLISALVLVISSIPYGMFIEIGLWGYTFIQSVSIRLNSIIPDMILGGPYGVWRSWVLGKMKSEQGRWLWRWFSGSIAFSTFQLPLYWATLFSTWLWVPLEKRASYQQILLASVTLAERALR